MIRRHLMRHLTEAQRKGWLALLLDTADEVGLPSDPEFRSALVANPLAIQALDNNCESVLRRRRTQRGVLMTVARSASYHEVAFPCVEEAAAFIAALSRYVLSPAGASGATDDAPVEIWASAGGLNVYLNDRALAATASGFGPPPAIAPASVEQLVAAGAILIVAANSPAYGRDEIISHLTAEGGSGQSLTAR